MVLPVDTTLRELCQTEGIGLVLFLKKTKPCENDVLFEMATVLILREEILVLCSRKVRKSINISYNFIFCSKVSDSKSPFHCRCNTLQL